MEITKTLSGNKTMRNVTLLEELQAACNAIKTVSVDPVKPETETLEVGDIVYNSWGWEQTNIDFYVVTRRTAKTVNICRIASKVVETTQHMSEYVVADAEHAAEILEQFGGTTNVNERGVKGRRVQAWEGGVSLKMQNGYCGKWDDEKKLATYYA